MPDTKNIARIGMLVAVAFVLSYIESVLPLNLGIPGIKAGLSNIVVVFSIFNFPPLTAFSIAIVRIVLSGLAFGVMSGMFYSLAGGILSFIIMLILKKTRKFSVYGVSVAGGVSHNIGQLLVAMLVVETLSIMYYVSVLLVAGLVTGLLIGIGADEMLKRLKNLEM